MDDGFIVEEAEILCCGRRKRRGSIRRILLGPLPHILIQAEVF